MNTRFVAVATAVLFLGPAAASEAQPAPTPVPTASSVGTPSLPAGIDPYARAAIDILGGVVRDKIAGIGNSNVGQITYFKRFEMQISTGANAYRSIHLHPGTVIDPRGESLAVGERINVSGRQQPDGSLDADTITIYR